MKKRNIALVIALSCCLALSGCSKSEPTSELKPEKESSQTTIEAKVSDDDAMQATEKSKEQSVLSIEASPDEWFTFDKKNDDEVQVSGHTFKLSDETIIDLVIPGSHEGKKVTAIGSKAFYACSFSTVIIPDGVNHIASYAFRDCANLSSVYIPSSVRKIDLYSFSNCASLTSITIPEGVEEVRNNAFDGCTSLTTISFPSTITLLNEDLFLKCDALTAIYVVKGSYADTWFSERYPDLIQYQ